MENLDVGDMIFLSAAIGFAIAVFLLYFQVRRPANNITNEPPVVPDMGSLEFVKSLLAKDGPFFLVKKAREMGEDVFRMPSKLKNVFIVGDYRVARTILEDPRSTKPYPFYEFFDNMANGKMFFAHNGERALHVRKATSHAFSPQNVKRMTEMVEEILERWITDRLEPLYVKANVPIDVDHEMILITTEVIAKVAFDHDLTVAEKDLLLSNLRSAMGVFYMVLNPLKKFRLTAWMFPSVRKGRQAANDIKALCVDILAEYRAKANPNENLIIHMIANNSMYASDEERHSDMVAYLFGGFDTTAHSIAWTLLQLALCPQEQNKLRASLRKCKSSEEARHCSSLKNIVRESLRLNVPPALGSIRTTGVDVKVPGKRIIPAGSICMMPYFLILRNDQVFEEPDSFLPSRWENPSEECLRAYLPFAAGRRNCQGQALAYAELNTVLARLCCKYEFTVVSEGVPEYFVTLKPVGARLAVTPAP